MPARAGTELYTSDSGFVPVSVNDLRLVFLLLKWIEASGERWRY